MSERRPYGRRLSYLGVDVLEGHEPALHSSALGKAGEKEALDVVDRVLELAGRPGHEARRQSRPLPQVLCVDLRHACPEAARERGPHRQQLLALSLQAVVVRQMKVNR